MAQVFDGLAALFRPWLAEAARRGDIDADMDLDAAAGDLVAAMEALSVIGRVYNDPQRVKDQGDRLLRSILGPKAVSARTCKATLR